MYVSRVRIARASRACVEPVRWNRARSTRRRAAARATRRRRPGGRQRGTRGLRAAHRATHELALCVRQRRRVDAAATLRAWLKAVVGTIWHLVLL
eukprot:6203127-Pleurochrysis_carterae.AAC.2